MLNAILEFLMDPRTNLWGETLAFLHLCLVPITASAVIGITTGILVSKNATLGFLAINASNLIRAVPVLATLFLFVPIFKVGFLPAAIALTLLGIPPVLINTYTGLRGIDSATLEAAQGMGMTNWQIIMQIKAPLVLPVIVSGVRTSAVQIVATAPLGGLIGAGGYGSYIIDGVNTLNTVEILAGSLLVAGLALALELFMEWAERRLTPTGVRFRARGEVATMAKAARI